MNIFLFVGTKIIFDPQLNDRLVFNQQDITQLQLQLQSCI